MRPVMGVPNVIKARYSMKCIFCDTKNGTRLLTGPLSPRSNYACSPCIGRCLHSVCSQELQIIIPCHLCICHQRGTFDSDVMLFFSIASVLVCILHIFSHFIRLNICSLVSGWCDISDVWRIWKAGSIGQESVRTPKILWFFYHDSLPDFLLQFMTYSRFCPKHRDQQAIERAKVKQQITSCNMDSSELVVSRNISVPKQLARIKQSHKSIESPIRRTTFATPKKQTPLTKVLSKTPSIPAPTASLGSKHSRRDTPSTNARPFVNADDDHVPNSPKSPHMARKSKNNEATVEETRVLKEYRSVYVPAICLTRSWLLTTCIFCAVWQRCQACVSRHAGSSLHKPFASPNAMDSRIKLHIPVSWFDVEGWQHIFLDGRLFWLNGCSCSLHAVLSCANSQIKLSQTRYTQFRPWQIGFKHFFTVEGSRERCSERLQENTYCSVSSLLGKGLAQSGAKLVLGTASDIFQVSWKATLEKKIVAKEKQFTFWIREKRNIKRNKWRDV